MLSLNCSAEAIRKLRSSLPANQAERYQSLFDQGEAHVFYERRPDSVLYSCYVGQDYGEVSFYADGTADYAPTPLSKFLALFVYEHDRMLSAEQLETLYGEDYAPLKRFIDLGPKGSRALSQLQARVDDLVQRVAAKKRAETPRPAQCQFVFDSYRDTVEVSARLGFTKLYMNRKIGTFIRDYFAHVTVHIQKEYCQLPPKSFPSAVEAAFEYLSAFVRDAYYGYAYAPRLSREHVAEFLSLLSGEVVEWNGVKLPVRPEIELKLVLHGDGTITPEPAMDAKKLRWENGRAYVIEKDHIQTYRFASEVSGELYGFYESMNRLDPAMVSEILADRVLPLLDDKDISIEPEFLSRHPVRRPHIEYYVGLESEKALSFKTVFYLGDRDVDKWEYVASSPACETQVAEFERRLQALSFPLEGRLNGEEAIFSFLTTSLASLEDLCKVYVSEELQARKVLAMPKINIVASSGEDWFSMSLDAEGYDQEELLTLFNAFTRKKRFVRLRGNYVDLQKDEDDQLQRISESFAPTDFGVELPLYQALKLPSATGNVDGRILDLIHEVDGYESTELGPLPKPIETAIRPYQRTGIRFLLNLYRLKLSGILSDDMGLGKTLQSFGLFSQVKENAPILVVCPKSLIYNWLEERNKWYPNLPAHVLVGSPKERTAIYTRMGNAKKKTVYFISYDTLRNDIEQIEGIDFGLVLLDEGQFIANSQAQKTQAVKRLKSNTRIVLTGTPVQNSLLDLWSIFDFLLTGYFPPQRQFKEHYGALAIAGGDARSRLLAKIKPFLLGRKKKDVLSELPDKENITLSIEMSETQRKVYLSWLTKARHLLETEESRINLLAMMTRLRQICVSPSLFLEGQFDSTKLDYLITALCDLKFSGRKAIVFSSFVGALDLIRGRCALAGLTSETISGDTSARVRVILAERFNKPDSNIDVMLVSLKAGGTGLNLVGADTVFHLDPWWNLAAERQAEDRAHRIGQTHKVTVFKLVIKDSIEEKVISLQQTKGMLIDLTDEASMQAALTDEDYRFLLS